MEADGLAARLRLQSQGLFPDAFEALDQGELERGLELLLDAVPRRPTAATRSGDDRGRARRTRSPGPPRQHHPPQARGRAVLRSRRLRRDVASVRPSIRAPRRHSAGGGGRRERWSGEGSWRGSCCGVLLAVPAGCARCSRAPRWRKPKRRKPNAARGGYQGLHLRPAAVGHRTDLRHLHQRHGRHRIGLRARQPALPLQAPRNDQRERGGGAQRRHPLCDRVAGTEAPADGRQRPTANRFDVVEMVSPWTENFANVGTEASGIFRPATTWWRDPAPTKGSKKWTD